MIDLVHGGELGMVRLIEASNTQVQGPRDQRRLKSAMAGGGALPDIGLYWLNGVRSMLGEEPVEVFARIFSPDGDERYSEVEETIAFMLRFPSGAMANCSASYGAHESKDMKLYLEKAASTWKTLSPIRANVFASRIVTETPKAWTRSD